MDIKWRPSFSLLALSFIINLSNESIISLNDKVVNFFQLHSALPSYKINFSRKSCEMGNWERDQTSQISWSECSSRGSRLPLIVPSNKMGSWGMILRRLRRSWTPIVEISILSITIRPLDGSTKRNSAWIKVDLPLPVLPTIPIFFPPGKQQVTPRSTKGRFSLYRTLKKKTREEFVSFHQAFYDHEMII